MDVRRALTMALAAGLATWALQPARAGEPVPDAAIRARSYDVLIRRMDHYVDPAVGARVAERLRTDRSRALAQPDHASVMTTVTATRSAATRDRHLQIVLSTGAPPPFEAPRGDYGIARVERRPRNIGYLGLTGISGQRESVPALDAAMARLKGSRALVLDLRRNGGGGQAMLYRLLGHLLPARTELNGIAWRTCDNPPGARGDACRHGAPRIERQFSDQPPRPTFATTPVYVLTSRATFSAAEAAVYELRQHRRVTVVGERTGGGGNPSAAMDLESAFEVIMPIGRMHVVTPGPGWEGSGIAPDHAVPAAEAERVALRLAAG